jgi:ABC-type oligopeptide transport system substrate-binding subunit
MIANRWLKRLAPVILCLVLLVTACSSAPSKYDQVQKDTTGFRAPAAVDKQAEKGGTFNKFFSQG